MTQVLSTAAYAIHSSGNIGVSTSPPMTLPPVVRDNRHNVTNKEYAEKLIEAFGLGKERLEKDKNFFSAVLDDLYERSFWQHDPCGWKQEDDEQFQFAFTDLKNGHDVFLSRLVHALEEKHVYGLPGKIYMHIDGDLLINPVHNTTPLTITFKNGVRIIVEEGKVSKIVDESGSEHNIDTDETIIRDGKLRVEPQKGSCVEVSFPNGDRLFVRDDLSQLYANVADVYELANGRVKNFPMIVSMFQDRIWNTEWIQEGFVERKGARTQIGDIIKQCLSEKFDEMLKKGSSTVPDMLKLSTIVEEFFDFLKSEGFQDASRISFLDFLNWMIVEVAKKEGMEMVTEPLKISSKERCLHCGKFLSKKKIDANVQFCSGEHLDLYMEAKSL